ncbi:hypothetical protein Dimus_001102 [Dionaea muscipula]
MLLFHREINVKKKKIEVAEVLSLGAIWRLGRFGCLLADHAAIGGCGVVLPELGLDLVPISEKRCWADEAPSRDSQTGDGVLTGVLDLEIEDGEVLISPGPRGPLLIGRGEMSSAVDCSVKEATLEGVGDDRALKDLVDSVLMDNAPPPPSSSSSVVE